LSRVVIATLLAIGVPVSVPALVRRVRGIQPPRVRPERGVVVELDPVPDDPARHDAVDEELKAVLPRIRPDLGLQQGAGQHRQKNQKDARSKHRPSKLGGESLARRA